MTVRSRNSRSSRRSFRLVAAAATASLVFAACGGDDTDEPEVVEEEDTETDVDTDDAPEVDDDAPDVETDPGMEDDEESIDMEGSDDEGDIDAAMDTITSLNPQPSTVTMETDQLDGLMILASDPPLSASIMGDDVHSIVNEDADEMISCTDMAGTGEWLCQRMEGMTDMAEELIGGPLEDEFENMERPDRVDEREIAGRQALCLIYDDLGDGQGQSVTCVDPELGVMLSTHVLGFSMTAVEVSTEVDPSLFEPPAEPVDFDPEALFGGQEDGAPEVGSEDLPAPEDLPEGGLPELDVDPGDIDMDELDALLEELG